MTEANVGQNEASQESEQARAVGEAFENSIRIRALYLSNGLVLEVGEVVPGPDGEPHPNMFYLDAEEKKHQLKIAMILEFPEESVSETDEDGATTVTTRREHYEVWTDAPTAQLYLDIGGSRVVWTEKIAPPGYGAAHIEQNILDNVLELEEEPQTKIETPETPSIEP